MAMDIWFRDDVERVLGAAELASSATAAAMSSAAVNTEFLRGFRQGYRASLAVVAASFGLDPAEGPPREAVRTVARVVKAGE